MPLTEEENLAALGPKFRQNALKVLNLQAKAQEQGLSRGAQDATARFDSAIGGVQAGLQRGIRQQLADQVVQGAAGIGMKESEAALQNAQFQSGQELTRSENALNRAQRAKEFESTMAFEAENRRLAKEAGEKAGLYDLVGGGLKLAAGIYGGPLGYGLADTALNAAR